MKEIHNPKKNKTSLLTLIFTFLIASSSIVSISIATTDIPIVIQNMFVVLAGAILGGVQGAGATGLFLVFGALGVPVFSGFTGGLQAIIGPTGGYIIGYFFASLFSGLLVGIPSINEKNTIGKLIRGTFLGYIIIHIIGLLQYKGLTGVDFNQAINICIVPFLPVEAIKIIITVLLAMKFRPIIAQYLQDKK